MGARCNVFAQTGLTNISLTFENLHHLAQGHYEVWAYFSSSKDMVSLGAFRISEEGSVTTLNNKPLDYFQTTHPARYAEKFFVTIEAEGDSDTIPSGIEVMRGDRVGDGADLQFVGLDDYPTAAKAQLTTRTDESVTTRSGVWFVDKNNRPLFSLPKAPGGWLYYGYTTLYNIPLAMGGFVTPSTPDTFDEYSKKKSIVQGAGEDFLRHLPRELKEKSNVLPPDLTKSEGYVVLTLEPSIHGNDPTGSNPSQYILYRGPLTGEPTISLTNISRHTFPRAKVLLQ